MVHDTHLYDLLSVPATATQDEISRSYKRLALRYHPDKTNHDPVLTEKFKEATRAYEILKDLSLREVYDVYGEGGLDGSAQAQEKAQAQAQAQANTHNAQFHGSFNHNPALALFSQLFNDMSSVFNAPGLNAGFPPFGFNQGPQGGVRNVAPGPPDPNANMMRRGTDIHHTFNVSLADMYYGKVVKFQLPKTTKCTECNGVGCFNPSTCSICHGSGRVVVTVTSQFLKFQEFSSCSACRGTGIYHSEQDQCRLCDNGYLTVKKIVLVSILPGSKNGDMCILEGQSDEGRNIIPGNLIIHLKEMPHQTLVRRFNDLYLEQDIDLRTALVGGSIEVRDFIRKGRNLRIYINSHGQSALNALEDPSIEIGEVVGTINLGSVKIVKGLGMPINHDIRKGTYIQKNDGAQQRSADQYKRGDLFIRFNVQIPSLDQFGDDDMRLLARILPRNTPDASSTALVHHLANLHGKQSRPALRTELLGSAEAPEEVKSLNEYDYETIDIDSDEAVEKADEEFYKVAWSKDNDIKRRRSNRDSSIPPKLHKSSVQT